jgi:hypothetical protein
MKDLKEVESIINSSKELFAKGVIIGMCLGACLLGLTLIFLN